MTFNYIDALLLVVVLLSAWAGVRRGLIVATFQLLTLLAALAAGFVAYPFAARWLGEFFPAIGVWSTPLSFVAIFVFSHLIIGALASRIALGFSPKLHTHPANRTLGVVPGCVNGAINALLVSMLLTTAPIGESIDAAARESEFSKLLVQPAEWVEAQLTPVFDPAIRKALQAFTVPTESHQLIELHFKIDDAKSRPDLEARMLELVNAERAKEGLKPLKADPEMAAVARAHSQDMFARGYFSHVTPDGKDLSQRVRAAHVQYLLAGENLALARSLTGAHNGLMNSPGHRANIMRPQFGRVGIAVLDGGMHGLMITQNFRN